MAGPPAGDGVVAGYLGTAFALFLATLASSSGGIGYVASLQSRGRLLAARLLDAEERLRQLRRGRREAEMRAEAAEAEVARLQQELQAREAAIAALTREREEEDATVRVSESPEAAAELLDEGMVNAAAAYGDLEGFEVDQFYPPPPDVVRMPLGDTLKRLLDGQYEPQELMLTNPNPAAVPRRESPWKADIESSGVSTKLQLLEQEFVNLENMGFDESSKILTLVKKHAKKYQSLASRIDDLCKIMQRCDPGDPSLKSEFRTQRQMEFLLEAFRLQQRAAETRQKLGALQTETLKSSLGEGLTEEAKASARRALGGIRNNFKEVQRSLEIWLARILGDLEGMLARDGASRMREYLLSPYSSVR